MDRITKVINWTAVFRWLPALAMMGLIFYASSIPSSQMIDFGAWDRLVKKSGHFLGYSILGLTYLRAGQSLSWRAIAACVLLAAMYALTDEFHQSFVPGRTSTLVDVGIDSLGAATGLLLARFFLPLGRLVFSGVKEAKV